MLVHLFLKNVYFYVAFDPEFDLTNPEVLKRCKMRSAIKIKNGEFSKFSEKLIYSETILCQRRNQVPQIKCVRVYTKL